MQRLLRCRDQAGCLVPHLQLATPLRVYMCKHPARHGVRFYYLVAEGLRAHPGVTLVQVGDSALTDMYAFTRFGNLHSRKTIYSSYSY